MTDITKEVNQRVRDRLAQDRTDYGFHAVVGKVFKHRHSDDLVTLLVTPLNEHDNTRYAVYRRHSDCKLLTCIKTKFDIVYEYVEGQS